MGDLQPFSSDTHPEIHALLIARLQSMTQTEKLAMVSSLNRSCEALALAGIASRFPDATDEETRMRLGVLRVGPDLMLQAFGWDARERGR